MDADILQAIRIIDAKIASLQEARNRLATAFGIGEAPPPNSAPLVRVRNTPINDAGAHEGPTQPSGRKVQLAEFLAAHGAMSRTAIVEQAGIPEGTVSYCLNDKRFFEQLENGDWDITEYSKRGLERRAKQGTFQENVQ